MEVKIGIIAAYDIELIKYSLPPVYKQANKIVIAVDKNRRAWNGDSYTLDENIFQWIKEYDVDHKIQVYQDDFCDRSLTSMQNETRERNMLAAAMGKGGWHIQLDTDEYFIDFDAFVGELRSFEEKQENHFRKVTIAGKLLTLFKQIEEGFLYINNTNELVNLATNNPVYTLARRVEENETIYSNTLLLHQSWARTKAELTKKLETWGHNTDFDTRSFYNIWDALDGFNYRFIQDFHPLGYKGVWPGLKLIRGGSIEEVIANAKQLPVVNPNSNIPILPKKSIFIRVLQLFIPPIVSKLYKKVSNKINLPLRVENYRRRQNLSKLKDKDFTIIGNNCWAGSVYEDLSLEYKTPTVGLFFYPECYLKFIKNLSDNLKSEIIFSNKSKYFNYKANYPIGNINGIEIHFLHYKNDQEAREKWQRRVERVNLDYLCFAFSDSENCKYESLKEFDELPLIRKVVFTARRYNDIKSSVWLPEYENQETVGDIYTERFNVNKHFDVIRWLNKK